MFHVALVTSLEALWLAVAPRRRGVPPRSHPWRRGLPLPLGLGCESHWKIRVSGNMIFRIYIIYMKIILYNISDISLFIYIYIINSSDIADIWYNFQILKKQRAGGILGTSWNCSGNSGLVHCWSTVRHDDAELQGHKTTVCRCDLLPPIFYDDFAQEILGSSSLFLNRFGECRWTPSHGHMTCCRTVPSAASLQLSSCSQ